MFKKSVDKCISQLTDIAAELEAVIGREQMDIEKRSEEIAELSAKNEASGYEINRANRIRDRIDGFVS